MQEDGGQAVAACSSGRSARWLRPLVVLACAAALSLAPMSALSSQRPLPGGQQPQNNRPQNGGQQSVGRQGSGQQGSGQQNFGQRPPYSGVRPPENRGPIRGPGQGQGQHLPDWLQKHQNLSAVDQQNALRREPGFNRLPSETQQRLVERLQKLNNLPPQQRQRTLSRMEAMERLSPPQRDEVRRSAQQLGALPSDRQFLVRKAFRDLRDIPVEQRDAFLNSARFQGQFSPQERNILGTLLKVEPYQGGQGGLPYGTPAGR